MKYKVIGWTFYENQNFENAPLTFAARHAIVDDIRENNYLFSGLDHQEAWYGCPVLNDGKKRMCSQRGFAGIMAEAHGETDLYSYSKYMFGIPKETMITPNAKVAMQEILKATDLCENLSLGISKEQYDRILSESVLIIKDLPNMRYIDIGDSLTIICGSNKTNCEILGIDRYKNLTNEERYEISLPVFDIKELQAQQQKIREADTCLKIRLRKNKG